jgi:hypothetical protein
MPMRLCVGYPRLENLSSHVLRAWRQLEPSVDIHLGTQEHVLLRIDTPSIWGGAVLDWVASSLALELGLPSPFDLDQDLDTSLFDKYMVRLENEEIEESFPHLLSHGYEGIYLPIDPLRIGHSSEGPSPIGSSRGLLQDVTTVLAAMGCEPIASTRSLAKEWEALGGADGKRALETYIAHAHAFAARQSIDTGIPLFLEWAYCLKPLNAPLSYVSSRYHGFDSFRSAEVEPGGATLLITFEGGYVYRIPLDYIKYWLEGTAAASSIESASVHPDYDLELAVHIGGEMFTMDPDTVLTWCEPSYEGFGHSSTSRVDIGQVYRMFEPLRIVPR